jgi:hypothetical protein
MTTREQRRDEVIDDLVLADDAPADLFDQSSARSRELSEQIEIA